MIRVICLLTFFLLAVKVDGQFTDLQFYIADIQTKDPISDAHIFISNSSFGTVSDKKGIIRLSIPEGLREDLIVSHVSYDVQILTYAKTLKLAENDTIFLNPNGINIDEIVVTQKRSKSWKKNFKRFTEAFIGSGKYASKCKILNPEVLRFATSDGVFEATAVDMLKIENEHLGYNVEFLLEKLKIDNNGSMKYIGYANFIDTSSPKTEKKFNKNRVEAYIRSPKHFFEHLINNDLDKGKYKIRTVKYNNGVFDELTKPQVEDIIYFDSVSQHYLLVFDEFLEIKHLGFKTVDETNHGVRQGGLESSRFNSSQHSSASRISYPVSLLYKLTPSLIINKFGNVINHKAVQEYGYWATQRMALNLPLDYGVDYSKYRKHDIKKDKEVVNSTPQNVVLNEVEQFSSLTIIKDLIYGDKERRRKAFDMLKTDWDIKYLPPILDLMRINQDPYIHQKITDLLKDKVGISNFYEGLQWMWENESVYDDIYGSVKAEIYQHVDPKFKKYFAERDQTALIGLDEIVWGGVNQDGIPPLRYPKMIEVQEATYLSDDDIVFGISLDGDHRAYPKRILAWHEFFVDDICDKKIAGVYCTLCGTMIAYDMHHQGEFYDLGTSGFLYNSNKLMYDKETQSLWSTIEGMPVLGPLTDRGIRLTSYPSITTTWGEWKKMHPTTKVLSLDTGYERNYDEGEAYKSYFATDNLMFPVPEIDTRLKNKDEVLVIRALRYQNDPLAISIDYLKKKNLYQGQISGGQFVVIAEKDGWSRVYNAGDVVFKSYKKGVLKDSNKNKWKVTESSIIGPDNQIFERIPSHNAFWFAWYNAYPATRLIK